MTGKHFMRFTSWHPSQVLEPRQTYERTLAELVDELDETLFTKEDYLVIASNVMTESFDDTW